MISAHNLVIGTPYIDIGGHAVLRILEDPSVVCKIHFIKRGWLSKDEFKLEGDVQYVPAKKSKKKDKELLLYKVHGNWNSQIYVSQYKNGVLDPST